MEPRTPSSPRGTSPGSWEALHGLQEGDRLPPGFYLLDYTNGEPPAWTVHERRELAASGGVMLVFVDQGADDLDLFEGHQPIAVTALIFPTGKALRSRPHRLGSPMGHTLCDLNQQRKHYEKGHGT